MWCHIGKCRAVSLLTADKQNQNLIKHIKQLSFLTHLCALLLWTSSYSLSQPFLSALPVLGCLSAARAVPVRTHTLIWTIAKASCKHEGISSAKLNIQLSKTKKWKAFVSAATWDYLHHCCPPLVWVIGQRLYKCQLEGHGYGRILCKGLRVMADHELN